MKRYSHLTEKIATKENFRNAYNGYSHGKEYRKSIKEFEEELNKNLTKLLEEFISGSYKTSKYSNHKIYEPKERIISKLCARDHTMQWAILLQTENIFVNTYIRTSCACVKGRGTHDFVDMLKKTLHNHPEDTEYFVQLDIHHYFENIDHELLKKIIRRKIKDNHLLKILDNFVDSYKKGLPLGVKISQILANFFLYQFDWFVIKHFNIKNNPELLEEYANEYVRDCKATAKTEYQKSEIEKGDEYLKNKFISYLDKKMLYFRFADNMILLHKDKTFLHIINRIAIKKLQEDYGLEVNKSWHLAPVEVNGIDVCGYVFYHDYIKLRKRNKKMLCRQIANLRKKNIPTEEIQLTCASRIGFASHANTKHLLDTLGLKKYDCTRKKKSQNKKIIKYKSDNYKSSNNTSSENQNFKKAYDSAR